MSRKSLVLFVSFLLAGSAAIAARSFTPKANTRADVKAYVEHAAQHVAKHGADCAAFTSPSWAAGDYYIFVAAEDGKTICHPSPKIVGKSVDEIIDVNGKKVGVALVEAAKNGGGWVDYVWPRPGTTNPVPKSSYAVRVKGPDGKMYMVGSGGYELK